jgi:hypothetical protein
MIACLICAPNFVLKSPSDSKLPLYVFTNSMRMVQLDSTTAVTEGAGNTINPTKTSVLKRLITAQSQSAMYFGEEQVVFLTALFS